MVVPALLHRGVRCCCADEGCYGPNTRRSLDVEEGGWKGDAPIGWWRRAHSSSPFNAYAFTVPSLHAQTSSSHLFRTALGS